MRPRRIQFYFVGNGFGNELDPRRGEGELYARYLSKAGADAQLERFNGANHGFVVNFAWIPEFARVFETAGKFLSEG
ncbi:alpha/beta hydrolase [Glutamicibacter arilaitensis]|uniref:alpha/beta hydrolase n=1 Tax=Glutamicibacter arilaitensis TaxID=256701 RepID=UPI00384D9AC1